MRYRFGPFELDAKRFELRRAGVAVPAEPQVLSLLLLLVRERDRLVTKDELVSVIWEGRAISDAAVSSRIKSARRLVGDDGDAQALIQTVHGRGLRFVARVEEADVLPGASRSEGDDRASERPSIAVLPLAVLGNPGRHAIIAEALPHEIIRELARLRWLFVIARGSSFRFAGNAPDVHRIGELLDVRYLLSGAMETSGERLSVSLELANTRDQGVVWAERFEAPAGAVHDLRSEIVAQVVAALELRIPQH